MRAKIKGIFKVVLALLFSYSFTETFIPVHIKGIGYIIFVYIYLFILSFLVIGYLVNKSLILAANNQSFKKVLKVFLVVLLSFIILNIAIPKNFLEPMKYTSIILTPINKNTETNRNEVWLNKIILDQHELNLQKIEVSSGWVFKEGSIVSASNNHNPQILELSFKNDIKLVFGKHEWSGEVEIDNGVSQIIDLNAKSPSEETIITTLSERSGSKILRLTTDIVFISLLSMILIILFSLFKGTILSNRNKK